MALVTCPDCGATISDAALACVHCGRPQTPNPLGSAAESRPAAGQPEALEAEFPFFPVSTHKFVVLSICTLGFYELYWAYKNWQRIRSATGETLSPFWRAFFAQLWNFSLFPRIRNRLTAEGIPADWSPGFLATCYLLWSISVRLPKPWGMWIYLATFVPLIPVQRATQRFNERHPATEEPNSSYSAANVVLIVIGGILLVLALIGSVLPKQSGHYVVGFA